eukprot:2716464-Rhodomonas_salina.1
MLSRLGQLAFDCAARADTGPTRRAGRETLQNQTRKSTVSAHFVPGQSDFAFDVGACVPGVAHCKVEPLRVRARVVVRAQPQVVLALSYLARNTHPEIKHKTTPCWKTSHGGCEVQTRTDLFCPTKIPALEARLEDQRRLLSASQR